MSSQIDAIIDSVLDIETGEYTNRPADSGGPTKWGVTLATLSKYLGRAATIADVQALTREGAHAVLLHRFVEEPGFAGILPISEPIAAELVDTGVNMGPPIATMFLQRCLNAFDLNGRKYPDIAVDGVCGSLTRASLRAYLSWRGGEGEQVMLKGINCLKGERYIEIAEKRPKDEENIYGWLRARITIH